MFFFSSSIPPLGQGVGEKHHELKPKYGPLTDNKLDKGFQAGGVQRLLPCSPRFGGERRVSMANTTLSVGFHNPETVSGMLCKDWRGHKGDRVTYYTGASWFALSPHWPILSSGYVK